VFTFYGNPPFFLNHRQPRDTSGHGGKKKSAGGQKAAFFGILKVHPSCAYLSEKCNTG
jgi:hypothetical protein